jgi:hypothetical protein
MESVTEEEMIKWLSGMHKDNPTDINTLCKDKITNFRPRITRKNVATWRKYRARLANVYSSRYGSWDR